MKTNKYTDTKKRDDLVYSFWFVFFFLKKKSNFLS